MYSTVRPELRELLLLRLLDRLELRELLDEREELRLLELDRLELDDDRRLLRLLLDDFEELDRELLDDLDELLELAPPLAGLNATVHHSQLAVMSVWMWGV